MLFILFTGKMGARLPGRQWVLPVKRRLGFLQQRAFIHRFGSSLNGHVLFHVCVDDGAFEAVAL